MSGTIVWFRQDLRLEDNPALRAAAERGEPVVPVHIWAPDEEGDWPPGAAGRWWLHHSLAALAESLADLGSRLIVAKGESLAELRRIANATGARAVFWNRRYEPVVIDRDKRVEAALGEDGLDVEMFNAALAFEPWEVATKQDTPYRVFTPFWNAVCEKGEPPGPEPAPDELAAPKRWPASLDVDDLDLLPDINWTAGLAETWEPGEEGAAAALDRFLEDALADYETGRDQPDRVGTSRLSPYLHWGEISIRRVWHAVLKEMSDSRSKRLGDAGRCYLRELGWREFSHHLLWHFPHTPTQPFNDSFKAFPWSRARKPLEAWRQGRTGYPIVDAGMRELWHTGWMHNRVRMIVASFLTKDLLIPWQHGARWFWDTLVDADLANNTLGWQWTSGCGADAAPYFRIFNPTRQGRKFDPEGTYVRQWVPELDSLSGADVHEPWKQPDDLFSSGQGDEVYPAPMVDHGDVREQALAAYEKVKAETKKRR